MKNWLRSLFAHKPSQKPVRKAGSKIRPGFELLEDRLAPSATVWTDCLDYPPPTTATIFGSGYQAGETAQLRVVHLDNIYQNQYPDWLVTDGDSTPEHLDASGVLHMPDLDGKVDGN